MSARDRWARLWAAHGNPNMPPSRGAVAGWLYAKARPDATRACAGVPWLAGVAGLSERTVKRVVGALKQEGWVAVRERGHYRGPNRKPTATIYDLTVPDAHQDAHQPVDNSEPTGHQGGTLAVDANRPKSDANRPPRGTHPFPYGEGARSGAQPPAAPLAARKTETRAGAAVCGTCGNRANSAYHRNVCKGEQP